MLFKEIQGNRKTKQNLKTIRKNNKVGHAYLFLGDQGSAKLAIAIAFASFLNCKKDKEDSCGTCSDCIKYSKLQHPDFHLVFPVLKNSKKKYQISDNYLNKFRETIIKNPYVSFGEWNEIISDETKSKQEPKIYKDEANKIKEKTALKNYEGKFRVFLLWLPEKMNRETSNKLLKLLEEPPKGTVFLLVSENTKEMLPTIISRTQIIKIKRFKTQEIIKQLQLEEKEFSRIEELNKITQGDISEIKNIIQNKEQANYFELFSEWMRLAYKMNITKLIPWIDKLSQSNKQNQELFCVYSISIIRECIMSNFYRTETVRNNNKEKTFIKKFTPFINAKNAYLIIKELEDVISGIKRNGNIKILFFNLSLKMEGLLKTKNMA